ncbi:hypothetical protein J4419_00345 [Candidatus Woesearchaeota archaeon]|nr:hypothetical protein [Candidatus Woesearchaeota archaeon]
MVFDSQKKTLEKLQAMGFVVEINRVVGNQTKVRRAIIDIPSRKRLILERQMALKLNW